MFSDVGKTKPAGSSLDNVLEKSEVRKTVDSGLQKKNRQSRQHVPVGGEFGASEVSEHDTLCPEFALTFMKYIAYIHTYIHTYIAYIHTEHTTESVCCQFCIGIILFIFCSYMEQCASL